MVRRAEGLRRAAAVRGREDQGERARPEGVGQGPARSSAENPRAVAWSRADTRMGIRLSVGRRLASKSRSRAASSASRQPIPYTVSVGNGHQGAAAQQGRPRSARPRGSRAGARSRPRPLAHPSSRAMRATRSMPARSGRKVTATGTASAAAQDRTASACPAPISSSATPPGGQPIGELTHEPPNDVQPVAAAVERGPRLERDAARRRGDLRAGQVREVGGHHVGERQPPGRVGVGRPGPVEQVAQRDRCDLGHAVRGQVLRGELQGIGREVARHQADAAEGRAPRESAGPGPGPPRRCRSPRPRPRPAARLRQADPRSPRWRPRPGAPSPAAG